MEYRASWLDSSVVLSSQQFEFHHVAAESVAKSQSFCVNKESNIAAFAICVHNLDGSIAATAALPYIVSSGDQKSGSSGISTVLVKEMFLKLYDGLSPLDAEIQFVDFVEQRNGYKELEPIKQELIKRKSQVKSVLAIPDLTFTTDPTNDKLLGSILHCEQAVLVKTMLSDSFLIGWIGKNFDSCVFNPGSFLSFNVITYNDMCPKCFFTCTNIHKDLEKKINDTIMRMYPSKFKSSLPLRIFISSFRPYAVDADKHTRACMKCISSKKPCTDYMMFHEHTPVNLHRKVLDALILQFFNPWMASAVVSFDAMDSIDAILKNRILLGDAAVLSKIVADPQKLTDQQKLLRCIDFSKESYCFGGLNSLAAGKLADYRAKLEATRKMIDDVMNDFP
jgi:hypothetical protein